MSGPNSDLQPLATVERRFNLWTLAGPRATLRCRTQRLIRRLETDDSDDSIVEQSMEGISDGVRAVRGRL